MAVYITGIGIVSSLGINVETNLQALVTEKSGIAPIKYFAGDKNFLAGEVKYTNEELTEIFDLHSGMLSRTALLGIIAAKECWAGNSFHKEIRTGLISATTVGGMDITESYYRKYLHGSEPSTSLLNHHDSGNTTERIAGELGLSGYVNTISTACSSGANAIMIGARLIKQGKLDRVLVGGTDALCNFTLEGFNSLMIYDSELCKPFDRSRKGLNLGEGAAFLLLESEACIAKTGNKPLARVGGWANTADAYHQTASSPEGVGATLAMQQAMATAKVTAAEVDYINAHGTGTQNNDLSESVAINNIFGEKTPLFSSTKAYTGHTLAAAGAIEAVFSVLAIRHNYLFPNLNFSTAIEETGLVPVTQFRQADKMDVILSNSFGFGGNNTSLVFLRN